MLFASDDYCRVVCCSWTLIWCLLQVIINVLFLLLLQLTIGVLFVAADFWLIAYWSWSLTWCLKQLIIGMFFVCFRWSFPCYCCSCVVVVIVVADHFLVVCCSWLFTCCLLQPIIDVVYVATDHWRVVCCSWFLARCSCSCELAWCLLRLIINTLGLIISVVFVAGDQDACHRCGSVRPLLAATADLQRTAVHLSTNQSVRIR